MRLKVCPHCKATEYYPSSELDFDWTCANCSAEFMDDELRDEPLGRYDARLVEETTDKVKTLLDMALEITSGSRS